MSGIFNVGPTIFSVGREGSWPLYVVLSGDGLSTITFPFLKNGDQLQPQYTKLRDVKVCACTANGDKGLGLAREFFPKHEWLYVGCGPRRLFIQSNTLENAVVRIKNLGAREAVRGLVRGFFGLPYDSPELPRGHQLPVDDLFNSDECRDTLNDLEERGYKITTAACPFLSVVSLKAFYSGVIKVHRKAVVLHSQDTSLMGRMVVLTKSAPAGKDEWLKREVQLTSLLPPTLVPNIVRPILVTRGIGSGEQICKIGLVSKWFGEGDLLNYIEKHGSLLGRKERLSFSLQIAETLCQIHNCQLVYGDMKPENILVQVKEGKPQLFFCDFGLTESVGKTMTSPLGTYPSPESLGVSGKIINQSIDCWAFGLTLFGLLHGTPSFLKEFHYKSDLERLKAAREKLLGLLSKEDPIDDLIRDLLDLDPLNRPNMAIVVEILQTVWSS